MVGIFALFILSHSSLDMFPPKPAQVEKLFRQSAEFCSEHEVWKLNVAHVFFMQVCALIFLVELMCLTYK